MIFEQPVNIYSQDYVLKRFQSNETAVQVVRGKISALISESELIELQNSKATMYSKLASAVLDINSLQMQFSDISSKYDTVTGQYSSLDAKVADYKAGLDGLSVNLTNLSTRINNDYSTTTAMNAVLFHRLMQQRKMLNLHWQKRIPMQRNMQTVHRTPQ